MKHLGRRSKPACRQAGAKFEVRSEDGRRVFWLRLWRLRIRVSVWIEPRHRCDLWTLVTNDTPQDAPLVETGPGGTFTHCYGMGDDLSLTEFQT